MESKDISNRIYNNWYAPARHSCLFLVCFSPAFLMAQAVINVTPSQNITDIVHRSPANSTFNLFPGVYRLAAIQPKDGDRFIGQPGTILNGSQLLHLEKDGNLWSTPEVLAQSDPKLCQADHPRCFVLSDLFIDNVRQEPATDIDHLSEGSWYYDADQGKIFLGTDPTGHTVELSKVPAAFYGSATNVEIQNLIVEKYASPPQRGAVGAGGAFALPARWNLERLEIRWNHGGGLHVGSGSQIEDCNVHDNGQIGIGGSGNNILVADNHIDSNNFAGYRVDWEAGAVKFAKTDGLILRSNTVDNNRGNGLWTDIDNIHVLMEKNTVTNNSDEGIRHEIGYDAIIRYNLLRGNKDGIVIALSSNVQVYGNVIEVPANGNFGIRLDVGHRQDSEGRPYQLSNVSVHNNIISYLGPQGRSGLVGAASAASDLSFDANEYHFADGNNGHNWRWDNQSLSLEGLRQLGVEVHGKSMAPLTSLPNPTQRNP